MTTDELLKLNPKFKEGKLNIGDVLVINNKKIDTPKSTKPQTTPPATGQKLGKIFLQPKQTIYAITKQYKISETELRKLNQMPMPSTHKPL
jgi:LysM repeat protein